MNLINETVQSGIWAFVPVLSAIIAVFLTRNVFASLFIGIISGYIILGSTLGLVPLVFFPMFFSSLYRSVEENIPLIAVLCLLGAIISVINASGGLKAYGKWVTKKIKSARGISLATVILGVLIFIDDYFSCLLLGAVMRPAADKHRVSREKLAYFIDSTAAPVCVLLPISSWTMTITQTMENSGIQNGLLTFINSVHYNFYAIFALLFVFYIAASRKDFSLMKKYEAEAAVQEIIPLEINTDTRGKVFDLAAPNILVIILSFAAILWLGGFFGAEKQTLAGAFTNADTTTAINIGAAGALIFCFLLYIPRKLMTVEQFFDNALEGIKSMIPAITILVLAKILSGIVTTSLGADIYIEKIITHISSQPGLVLLPFIIFIISAAAALGLGSWGTFLITIPLVAVIAKASNPEMLGVYLGATLGGAVFGDHASPITDTTVLTSICTPCNLITHVKTQLPYALLLCAGSGAAFMVSGFTKGSAAAGYCTGIIFIIISLIIIYKIQGTKQNG